MIRDKDLPVGQQQSAAKKKVTARREAGKQRQEKRAAENVAKGLTARGTPRSPRGTGRRRES